MKRTSINLTALLSISLIAVTTAEGENPQPEPPKDLPFVKDFDPARYLGRWYEVARLPTKIQPPETLAVAEYSGSKEKGVVSVTNSAFDRKGKKLSQIQGQAKLAAGDPPGRLLVSFGPAFPDEPNYHVLHVDKDYQYAVVGLPDRQSLWILARKVPVSEEAFDRLREIAEQAGFDVSKLIIAPWDKVATIPAAERDAASKP